MKVPHVKHYVKNEGTAHEQHELRIHFQPSMLAKEGEPFNVLDLLLALSKLEPHELLLPAVSRGMVLNSVALRDYGNVDSIYIS